jgi:methyltransferase (TIGR00027 family)
MRADKPSSTALFVANGLWWIAEHPRLRHEIPEETNRLNRAIVGRFNTGILSPDTRMGAAMLRAKLGLMQRFSVPGFYLHFVLRKRCIENFARESVRDDGQLIVLGAGFDTLSLRMARTHPEMRVVEIDHPATQTWKRTCLEGLEGSDRVRLMPLDLTRGTFGELLRDGAHQPGRPATFVAEGLLMYLSESDVQDTLLRIREACGPGTRVVFTCMDERSPGDFLFRNATRLMQAWLGWKHERFTWGLPRDKMADFLGASGYKLMDSMADTELRESLLSPKNRDTPLAIGEYVVAAESVP